MWIVALTVTVFEHLAIGKITTAKNFTKFSHGKQFRGVRWQQVGIPRLYCLCWYSTVVRQIAKPIPIRRLQMNSLHLVKILWIKPLRCCCHFATLHKGWMHTCKNLHVFVVFTIVYRLIITKHSVNIEQLPVVGLDCYSGVSLRRRWRYVLA